MEFFLNLRIVQFLDFIIFSIKALKPCKARDSKLTERGFNRKSKKKLVILVQCTCNTSLNTGLTYAYFSAIKILKYP